VPHPRPSVARPPDGEWAVVSVRDTGIGILPEDFPYIFDRFFRGSQAVLKTPGTGLGLPIVREILDLHGGHIQAESQLDVGSNFTVLLPLPQPEKERKITVLVADDEEQIGQVIHRFLSREGIKVQWVPNGHQALEAIAADPPELLILDLTMPVMDGYQVLEKLQVEGGGASLPVLVLSSWTEDKFQRIKRLGAVDFLNKPFSGTVLVDVVKRLIALSG
jgi:CheY-like chemotaxis protein